MVSKLLVLTSENGSAEDCSVFYATTVMVSSDTLKFDEPVFKESRYPLKPNAFSGVDLKDSMNPTAVDEEKLLDYIRSLGYTVEVLEPFIMTLAT